MYTDSIFILLDFFYSEFLSPEHLFSFLASPAVLHLADNQFV